MASVIFHAGHKMALDDALGAGGLDIRVLLCMSSIAGMDTDDNFLTDMTLDENDATGYARITLTGETFTDDDTGDYVAFTATNAVFSGLSGDATRTTVGALFYHHVTVDGDSVPWVYLEFSAAIPTTATQITLPCSTTDILRIGI